MFKTSYEIGQMVGEFSFVRESRYENKKRYAIFVCPYCNNEFENRIDTIRRGTVKSCGCMQKKLVAEAGTKIYVPETPMGNLTFVKRTVVVDKKGYAIFRCSCGTEFENRIDSVQDLRVSSCGCKTKELLSIAAKKYPDVQKNFRGTKLIPFLGQDKMDSFWAKVRIMAQPELCWDWSGTAGRYGYFRIGSAMYKANRVAYKLHYGIDPSDSEVMHSCDNGLCCNPSHLSLGTHADNMQDMVKKGRNRNSIKNNINS